MYDFTGDFETFYTGENDITRSGLYDTFRGSPDLPHWKGEHCSRIQNASDGTKFKSFIQEDEQLLFFRKSMCRPQRLVSEQCNKEINIFSRDQVTLEETSSFAEIITLLIRISMSRSAMSWKRVFRPWPWPYQWKHEINCNFIFIFFFSITSTHVSLRDRSQNICF